MEAGDGWADRECERAFGGQNDLPARLISRGGDLAYVLVSGTISEASDGPDHTKGETSGTVTGTVLLDLRRGWVTESRDRIEITSVVRSRDAKMRIKMTVTQWLRAID